MDLERIKQNLRLRSGRSKKPPKKPQAQPSSFKTSSTQAETQKPSTTGQPNGHSGTQSSLIPNGVRPSSQPVSEGHERETDQATTGPKSQAEQAPTKTVQTFVSPPASANGRVDGGERDDSDTREELSGILTGNAHTPRNIRSQTPTEMTSDLHVVEPYHSESEDFDLRPPAPVPKPPSIETIAELLFSSEYLSSMLYTPMFLTRFTAFLQKYRPQDYPLLMQYLEMSKAIRAVEYANAVAENTPAVQQPPEDKETETPNVAAVLDPSFQESCSSTFDQLVSVSLPLYTTYSLVRTISDCLTNEITGRSTVDLNDMVGGLSEVFCLTDPNQEDNPIIYASEEFYRLTGYGQDDVIGANCRFLQGPKTNRLAPRRIRESLQRGEETSETLLNYRRDGKAFINLLMVAPLHDDKGKVKYNIGAQVDVSQLIERGRVLEGFQMYLRKREAEKHDKSTGAINGDVKTSKKKRALGKLRELSELFDLEESAIVQAHSRSSSTDRDDNSKSDASMNTRRRFVDPAASDDEDDEDLGKGRNDWNLGQAGPIGLSGKLPGVYEKYMLIRPSPSLRIVFMSPKLRKYGSVVQSPFLSHVAAPAGTLSGLAESFDSGVPVAAKINFMAQRTENRHGTRISPNEKHEDGKYGRACWISATPLLGGDGRIGVWMVVFIDKAQAKAQRARTRHSQATSLRDKVARNSERSRASNQAAQQRVSRPPGAIQGREKGVEGYSLPIKPRQLDDAIYFSDQRQNSQQLSSAYQYQAATPVEEYRSADEGGTSSSPIFPAPRSDMPPQTPTYEVTDDNQFVSPPSPKPTSPALHRLRISPDSDEGSGEAANDSARTGAAELSDYTQGVGHDPMSKPYNRTPDSNNAELSPDASTLARSQSRSKEQEDGIQSVEMAKQRNVSPFKSPPRTPSPPESPIDDFEPTARSTKSYRTHTARSSATLPAGLGYMTHLRYGASGRGSPIEVKRGRKARREGESEARSDTDRCTSPNSVD